MRIVHADLELWVSAWIREHLPPLIADLPIELTWCSNKERPSTAGGPPEAGELHIVVRDDSGSRRDLLLKDSTLGLTVIGYSYRQEQPVKAAAERLVALIEGDAPLDRSGPIVGVPATLGPYLVQSPNDEARVYATCDVTLAGSRL